MRFCQDCGTCIEDYKGVCPRCGSSRSYASKKIKLCPRCGFSTTPERTKCPECYAALGAVKEIPDMSSAPTANRYNQKGEYSGGICAAIIILGLIFTWLISLIAFLVAYYVGDKRTKKGALIGFAVVSIIYVALIFLLVILYIIAGSK